MRWVFVVILLAPLLQPVFAPGPVFGQGAVRTVEIVVTGRDRWAYRPSPLTIRVGETVEWVNRDPDDAHNVSIPALEYDGRFLAFGETDQVTFTRPGHYRYICLPHPSMSGLIIVRGDVYLPFSAKARPLG